jgi:hypothetical protein
MSSTRQWIPDLHREVAACQSDLYKVERAIKARELELCDGLNYKALGANEVERGLALDLLKAKDAKLSELVAQRDELKAEEIKLAGDLEGARAERREWEWGIRLDQVAALRPVQNNHSGPEMAQPGDDVMDEVAQAEIDERVAQQVQAARPVTIGEIWGNKTMPQSFAPRSNGRAAPPPPPAVDFDDDIPF